MGRGCRSFASGAAAAAAHILTARRLSALCPGAAVASAPPTAPGVSPAVCCPGLSCSEPVPCLPDCWLLRPHPVSPRGAHCHLQLHTGHKPASTRLQPGGRGPTPADSGPQCPSEGHCPAGRSYPAAGEPSERSQRPQSESSPGSTPLSVLSPPVLSMFLSAPSS